MSIQNNRTPLLKLKVWFGIEYIKDIFNLDKYEIEINDLFIYVYKKK